MSKQNPVRKEFSRITVYCNQGLRAAFVLAVIGDESLIVYEMPNSGNYLRIERAGDPDWKYRSVSRKTLPKKWQRAVTANGLTYLLP